ncbi:MAG: hypothetical protein EAZ95_14645 [Bacteroidetes bacterium]|nr:MAG: hypothetical protein EAZ95_14645 [Bacteroidota bacterium]
MTEQEFWDWFIAHRAEVEPHLLSRNNAKAMAFYEQLCEVMESYSTKITPEIGIGEGHVFELTLSANGRADNMPFVEKLAETAPEIEGWRVVKFRAAYGFTQLTIEGLTFEEKEIMVSAHKVPGTNAFSITVYMKGYKKEDKRYGTAAFLYLDHAIGEYNVITRVRWRGCKKLDLMASSLKLYTLSQLAELMKEE